MKLVNLTPHPVVIFQEEDSLFYEKGPPVSIPPVEPPARMIETTRKSTRYDETGFVPTFDVTFGRVENLPDRKDGTRYIVSLPTALALIESGRNDILVPDTGEGAVRDANGRILGIRSFIKIHAPERVIHDNGPYHYQDPR